MRSLTRIASRLVFAVRYWLAPADFIADSRHNVATLTNAFLLTAIGLWWVGLLLLLVLGVGNVINILIGFVASVLLLGLRELVRRGHSSWATALGFGLTWVVFTADLYNLGTPYSVHLLGYLAAVIFVTWMSGFKAGVGASLFSAATVFVLARAAAAGLLPYHSAMPPLALGVNLAMYLGICSLLIALTRANFIQALQLADAEVITRRKAEADLRELNATLETRVAERTVALQASEARWQNLLALSPDAISLVDDTGRILYCNEQFPRLLGYDSIADTLDHAAAEFISPDCYRQVLSDVVELLVTDPQVIQGIEVTCVRRDGSTLITENGIARVPWRDAPGGYAYLCVFRDISQRKSYEADLANQRQQLATLVEQRTRALEAEIAERTVIQAAQTRIAAELSERVQQLSSLQSLNTALNLHLPVGETVEAFFSEAVALAGIDLVQLYLMQDGQLQPSRTWVRADLPNVAEALQALTVRLCDLALADCRTVYAEDAFAAPSTLDADLPPDARSFDLAAFPLQRGVDPAFGILLLGAAAPSALASQLNFLETFAGQMSLGLSNSLLHRELQAYAAGLLEMVTQRTRELQTERDRVQAVLETVGESVIVTDIAGQILFANPATLVLTGYTREEVTGRPIWHNWSGSATREMWLDVQATLAAGRAWHGETTAQRKEGMFYIVALMAAPLHDESVTPDLSGAVWVQSDITALKEAERLKDEFVSNVSHELRTPISIIRLSCQNWEAYAERLSEAQRKQILLDIREQTDLLEALVSDILTLAQANGDKTPRHVHVLDLALLVRDEAAGQEPLAARRGQELTIKAPERVTVLGAELQLRQIIRNLLDNAIKYTPVGGRIACTCEIRRAAPAAVPPEPCPQGGPWAVIEVSDDGPGIAPEELPLIFQRFYRAQPHSKVPGTGLGLAIAQEIARLHQGCITVTSSPGQGSTFAVYLPLFESEARLIPEEPGRVRDAA